MDQLDFQTFDDRFQNLPEKTGSPLSEIDQKREKFIEENIDKLELEPVYPRNVPGRNLLIQRTQSPRRKAPRNKKNL